MTPNPDSALSRTFHLSSRTPPRRIRELREELEVLWRASVQSAPGALDDDIELLRKRFFDPVAQGKRLREQLMGLQPHASPITLPEPLRMSVDDGRTVVTPEGRAALELLMHAEAGGDAGALDERHALELELVLLHHYRRWTRHRIEQVIGLLGDEGLRPPVIGVLLTLLVNRSIGRSRAVRRFLEGPERDVIDEAFREPVGSFAQAIDPDQRRSLAKERLTSGWTLHEVTRRYPSAVRIEESDNVSLVYITEGSEDVLLDAVVRALARKHVGLTTASNAFDRLVESLRAQAPTLAGYGMLYERPAETAQLRQGLLDGLRKRQLELQQA